MKWLVALIFVWSMSAKADLKLVSYNIENYRASSFATNETLLRQTIAKMKPDLLAVQEIVDAKGFSRFLTNHFPNYGLVLSSCGGGGEQKLGFVFKKSALRLVSFKEDQRFGRFTGQRGCGSLRPAVIGTFEDKRGGEFLTVIGVHLKAGGNSSAMSRRSKQYLQIVDLVKSLRKNGQNIVVTGDFNSTGWVEKNQDYQNFARMLQSIDATTSAEHLECTAYWPGTDTRDNIEEPSMLDHVVVAGGLKNRIQRVYVGAHCQKVACQRVARRELGDTYHQVSDHCPIGVSIE